MSPTSSVIMSAKLNDITEEKPQRPPPTRSTRRLSFHFRTLNHAIGIITHIDIFTGSLTGTSERLASSLSEKASQSGAVVSMTSLENFNPTCFIDPNSPYHYPSRVTVFVVSTHFAGGPSPNAEMFSQWLRLASGNSSGISAINPALTNEIRPSDIAARAAITTTTMTTATPTHLTTTPTEGIQDSSKLKLLQSTQATLPKAATRPRHQSSFSATIRPHLRINWREAFNSGSGSGNSTKPRHALHGVQYAVFGVGNSMHLTYNAMGKFVDARMQALGAVRLCPLGLGDVSNDINGAFEKWEAHLLQLIAYPKRGPLVEIAAKSHGVQSQMTASARGSNGALALQAVASAAPSLPEPSPPSFQTNSQHNQIVNISRQTNSISGVSSPVSATESPVKLTLQDRYGRHVRLRFRCRYVDKQETKPYVGVKLPTLAGKTETSVTHKLSPSHSSMRRHASHIRHPCIALQSITVLKCTTVSGDCEPNMSAHKEVSLARLVILDPELTFETADTFGYFPPNSKDIVDAIGSRLGLDMNANVEISFYDNAPAADPSETTPEVYNKNRHLPFPNPCSIRTILSDFLELRTISRELVRVASSFVTDQNEQELLETLASIDGSAAFNREFAQSNSGMLKLLELAPSLRMPFEVLVNITPLLKPRLYSIASSHVQNDREFDIIVALGNPTGFHGLSVSNFRHMLSTPNIHVPSADPSHIPVIKMLRGFVAASRFKTPSDLSAPMIMIANGIGIAPFRAILQHRQFEAEGAEHSLQNFPETLNPLRPPLSPSRSGNNLLLLGCSTKSSVIFESELRNWESSGFLDFHVVHSSEPGQPAQYVQDLVAAHKQDIVELMSNSLDARIYICGKVAMARAVNHILVATDTANGNNTWYQKALQSGRYIEGIYE